MEYYFGFKTPENIKKRKQSLINSISEIVCDFFWEDAPSKYGYENREGQQDMAFEILDAIKADKHIAVEAGVGIGKSFAYLVPLLLYNNKTGIPIVIATSTIALQEQLLDDAEDLKELLNIKSEIILAKGQSHYICQKRADEYFENNNVKSKEHVRAGIIAGHQDRRSFSINIPNTVWDNINIARFSKHECALCKHEPICQYCIMREKIKFTDGIILCNQDLLTNHLLKIREGQDGFISEFVEIITIDEAHNLEGKVRNATTARFGQNSVINTINAAQSSISAEYRRYTSSNNAKTIKLVRSLYQNLNKQMQRQVEESKQDMRYVERFFFRDDNQAVELIRQTATSMSSLSSAIQLWGSMGETPFRRERNSQAVDDLIAMTKSFSELSSGFDSKLVWLEKAGKYAELVFCPKNTKRIISQLYFERSARVVLTSATLTNTANGSLEQKYSYFIQNTGFPTGDIGVLSDPKPSPFPYDEHAMIYYCDDLPHPTKEHSAFIEKGVERLLRILEISNGKALVLFTAKTDMEEVYKALLAEDLPYKIIMQQSGSSQERTLQEFRENTTAVLLGSGAFWEGISVEGEALSNLVIFRLPFPVPDPIIEYKASLAKDHLMEVRVPEMVIMLKQGIGRLIRNFTDKGLVSIIDSRLRDNPAATYRDIVWDALPIHNRTTDLAEAKRFYDQLEFPTTKCIAVHE